MRQHAAAQCHGTELRMTPAQLRECGVDLAAAGYSHVTVLAVLPTGTWPAFDLSASRALAWRRSGFFGACADANTMREAVLKLP